MEMESSASALCITVELLAEGAQCKTSNVMCNTCQPCMTAGDGAFCNCFKCCGQLVLKCSTEPQCQHPPPAEGKGSLVMLGEMSSNLLGTSHGGSVNRF